RERQNGAGKYIGCANYPNCKNAVWLPSLVESIEVLNESCRDCGPNTKKLKMKFRQNPFPGEPNPNVLCIGGCDEGVLEALDISRNTVASRQNGTGPGSNTSTSHNATTNSAARANQTNPHSSPSIDNWNFSSIPNSAPSSTRNSGQSTDWSRTGTTNRPSLGSMPTNSSAVVGTGNEDIVCTCNKTAILLTVRKDGPNKGRQFYKCPEAVCNFFLWAPDPNGTASTSGSPRTSFGNVQQDMRCNCGQQAALRTVNKEGPNKGRQFYCCPKPIGEGCKFFKWADESDNDWGGGNGDGGGGGGGGGGGFRTANTSNWHGKAAKTSKTKKTDNLPYNTNKPRAKRKCGICGEEGHIRSKCPNNN
ncbi:unnamed protein product, partial [Callosobruchus maculatus]